MSLAGSHSELANVCGVTPSTHRGWFSKMFFLKTKLTPPPSKKNICPRPWKGPFQPVIFWEVKRRAHWRNPPAFRLPGGSEARLGKVDGFFISTVVWGLVVWDSMGVLLILIHFIRGSESKRLGPKPQINHHLINVFQSKMCAGENAFWWRTELRKLLRW